MSNTSCTVADSHDVRAAADPPDTATHTWVNALTRDQVCETLVSFLQWNDPTHPFALTLESAERTEHGCTLRLNDGSQWELTLIQRSVGYDRRVPLSPPTPAAPASPPASAQDKEPGRMNSQIQFQFGDHVWLEHTELGRVEAVVNRHYPPNRYAVSFKVPTGVTYRTRPGANPVEISSVITAANLLSPRGACSIGTWLPQVNDTVDIVKGPYKGCAAIVVRVDWDDAFPLTLSVIDGAQTAVLQSRLARVARHQPEKNSDGSWVPGIGDPVRLVDKPHLGQRGVIVAIPGSMPAGAFYRVVLSDPTVSTCGPILLLRREFELDPLLC